MLRVYQVSDVALYLRELLEADVNLADLWISGEVSNLARPASGHTYFTIKDESAQLRCVLFRGDNRGFDLANGSQVAVHGRVSFYPARGDIQIYVDFVRAAGLGILHLQLERLKAKLEEEGLFEVSRKRPLPAFPRRLGVVTSPSGAVFHDICHIVGRRWPLAEIVLAPAAVQGDGAATEIVDALRALNEQPDIDVIIVARGGGSLEELWPFNEEAVVRAIYASRVPVISAVGHETDHTIADLVADVRAPTPSAAAEIAVPDRYEIAARLRSMLVSMTVNVERQFERCRWDVNQQMSDLRRYAPDISTLQRQLAETWQRSRQALESVFVERQQRLRTQGALLLSLNPRATLSRGYALVIRRGANGTLVRSVQDVSTGDRLDVHVSDGQIPTQVTGQYGF